MLAQLRVALGLLRPLDRLVQHCHKLRAIAEFVHGAGLDQRLQYALVEQPQVHLLAELKDGAEAAQVLARRGNCLNRIATHVLHCG